MSFVGVCKILCVSFFPFGFEGGIWDVIVLHVISDHCLSYLRIYVALTQPFINFFRRKFCRLLSGARCGPTLTLHNTDRHLLAIKVKLPLLGVREVYLYRKNYGRDSKLFQSLCS